MFVNSDPPAFRKARALAVDVEPFEAHFLTHRSYVDTTKLIELTPEDVAAALLDPDRSTGRLSPALIARIQAGVGAHDVMPDNDRKIVLA
jgi:hypothetical protein